LPDATPPAQAGSLTDVRGLRVGHFTETRRPTGCTVIIAPEGAVAGVDVRGAAPGTRETELLSPLNAVETVHAVMLAGGSAFGLDAAGGVMRWLDERGIGAKVGPARIPIVPAAILFDLWVGDASIRPDAASGYAACEAASSEPVAEGNVGAGTGAEHTRDAVGCLNSHLVHPLVLWGRRGSDRKGTKNLAGISIEVVSAYLSDEHIAFFQHARRLKLRRNAGAGIAHRGGSHVVNRVPAA